MNRVYYALMGLLLWCAPVVAELTPESRSAMLKVTGDLVKEKVDDFEKGTTVSYSGPDVGFGLGIGLTASVAWLHEYSKKPTFVVIFSRVNEGWRWLEMNEAKVLLDGERMPLEQEPLKSRVIGGGTVSETKPIYLSLEKALRWVAAEQVRVKIGLDEFTLGDKEKLPLLTVLANWIGRGGDVTEYQDLAKSIFRPYKDMPYADVIQKYGAPAWSDKATGWATWERFWVRFQGGKAVEIKTRNPNKEKAAQ